MKVLAIFDSKAQMYLKPYPVSSLAEGMRSFSAIANDGESAISSFPNEFRLVHIADFDSNTGVLSPMTPFADLGAAADFKRRPQETLPFDNVKSV